jgi:hypothetical protein
MSTPTAGSVRSVPALGSPADAAVTRNAFALACGLPFVAYLVTLSGNSYWLDAGEFVEAAVQLDLAHPPGHPLAVIYSKLWTLLPIGSLAFRVALGQAVAAALASGFLYIACLATGVALGARGVPAAACALAGAWLWALSYGVWIQAVRPEVYALQGLVLLAAVAWLIRHETQERDDPRPLYAATFAVGLGLTNNHLQATLLMPALLVCAVFAARRRGLSPVVKCAALGLLALLVYVYLPVRAAREPPANFGAPVTLERFLWVVSARVYAKNVGAHDPEPIDQRVIDLAVALFEDLHVLPIVALAGLYVALRTARSRRASVLWLLTASTVLAVRIWIGSVRGNPDALGYAIAGVAALAALASAAFAALIALVGQRPRACVPLRVAAVCLAAAAGTAQIARTGPRADLSRFHGVEPFDEYRLRQLPARTVLLAVTPQAVFRHLELSATERARPDVVLIPVPFLGYPGVADAVARAHPDVAPLVGSFLQTSRIEIDPLLELAARRPVMTELEAHVPPETYRGLLPAGLLYAVVSPDIVPLLIPSAAAFQYAIQGQLRRRLGSDLREAETSRQLLWVRYMDALYYAAHGQLDFARAAASDAAALSPHDAHVRALVHVLDGASGPIDVRPFLGQVAPSPAL